jgi:hypothetical protein
MDWLWTWGGECFGYRRDDSLFAHHGTDVGRFHGDEIYGADGLYLGELRSGKLITDTRKENRRKTPFSPQRAGSYVRYVNHVGTVMYVGFVDFPSPETFA